MSYAGAVSRLPSVSASARQRLRAADRLQSGRRTRPGAPSPVLLRRQRRADRSATSAVLYHRSAPAPPATASSPARARRARRGNHVSVNDTASPGRDVPAPAPRRCRSGTPRSRSGPCSGSAHHRHVGPRRRPRAYRRGYLVGGIPAGAAPEAPRSLAGIDDQGQASVIVGRIEPASRSGTPLPLSPAPSPGCALMRLPTLRAGVSTGPTAVASECCTAAPPLPERRWRARVPAGRAICSADGAYVLTQLGSGVPPHTWPRSRSTTFHPAKPTNG